jgi:hypothetical protein
LKGKIMGMFSFLKKIKLPKIKLPTLSEIGTSGLGKFIGDTVSQVGTLAMQNAPALIDMASAYVPMGGIAETVLGGVKSVLSPPQTLAPPQPQLLGPKPTPVPMYAPSPLPQDVIDAAKKVPITTWKNLSDTVAPQLGKTKEAMWTLTRGKFASKGIPLASMDENCPLR